MKDFGVFPHLTESPTSNCPVATTGWRVAHPRGITQARQNIYIEAERHHPQHTHSRRVKGWSPSRGDVSILTRLRNRQRDSDVFTTNQKLFEINMNAFVALHCTLLISLSLILGKHPVDGKIHSGQSLFCLSPLFQVLKSETLCQRL